MRLPSWVDTAKEGAAIVGAGAFLLGFVLLILLVTFAPWAIGLYIVIHFARKWW